MKRVRAIATMAALGCAIVVRYSMAASPPMIPIVRPSEPSVEDRDASSKAVTHAIGALLGSDLADRDAVARGLQVQWAATADFGYEIETYRGVDGRSSAPFHSIAYRRSGGGRDVDPWSEVRVTISPGYCYMDDALVFNYAPEHVATPYMLPDGEAAGVRGRATFSIEGKQVLIAYRSDKAGAKCVDEILIKQVALSEHT